MGAVAIGAIATPLTTAFHDLFPTLDLFIFSHLGMAKTRVFPHATECGLVKFFLHVPS